jgi:hypothetical protein
VLAGRKVTLFDGALVGKAFCAFQEKFHALAAAKAADCIFISCQLSLLNFGVDRFTRMAALLPDPKPVVRG